MDEVEQSNKLEALREAARHRTADETADDIVINAEKYFQFLQKESTNE